MGGWEGGGRSFGIVTRWKSIFKKVFEAIVDTRQSMNTPPLLAHAMRNLEVYLL